MPNLAAAAAVWRAWLDWVAPWVMMVSAPLASGLAHQKFQLAGLVAAGGQAGAVVPLDPKARTAQMLGQPLHRFQRRVQMRKAQAGKAGKMHVGSYR